MNCTHFRVVLLISAAAFWLVVIFAVNTCGQQPEAKSVKCAQCGKLGVAQTIAADPS